MKSPLFSYSIYGCLLLVWALPSVVFATENDNNQALYSSIYIQPASSDATCYDGADHEFC